MQIQFYINRDRGEWFLLLLLLLLLTSLLFSHLCPCIDYCVVEWTKRLDSLKVEKVYVNLFVKFKPALRY